MTITVAKKENDGEKDRVNHMTEKQCKNTHTHTRHKSPLTVAEELNVQRIQLQSDLPPTNLTYQRNLNVLM